MCLIHRSPVLLGIMVVLAGCRRELIATPNLILVLRYDAAPGEENGRPLTEVMANYYVLEDGYPRKAAPMP